MTDSRGVVLVVEDEPAIADLLRMYLSREGFQVLVEGDGQEALTAVADHRPSCILLDVGLPGMDGIEVCRRLRAQQDWTPVVFCTARDDEVDRVLGLELGADDYITKPFSPREVLARIKAVLRRIDEPRETRPPLRFDGLEISLDNYQVKVGGESAGFTPKEVEILYLLASHPGVVLGREQIMTRVWGYEYVGDTRTVDTHIKRIRQKLQLEDAGWGLITVYGVGYKFEVFA